MPLTSPKAKPYALSTVITPSTSTAWAEDTKSVAAIAVHIPTEKRGLTNGSEF